MPTGARPPVLAHGPSERQIKRRMVRVTGRWRRSYGRYIEQLVVGTSPENLGAGEIKMITV